MEVELIRWDRDAAPQRDVLQRRLTEEGFDVSEWTDRPGARYAPHSHEEDESLWVLEGEISFGIGGAEYALGVGDRLLLPGRTVHSALAGPEGASYLIGQRRQD
jgi:quercetin dioxygenase-like cupin family protein